MLLVYDHCYKKSSCPAGQELFCSASEFLREDHPVVGKLATGCDLELRQQVRDL